jgi:uncharacterized membrane protein (UPF0182 family)
MLYVEPVYVKSNNQDAFPQLQRVLLSYGDGGSYVALAENLSDGIKQLVEQGRRAGAVTTPPPSGDTTPPPPPVGTPPLTGELADAANRCRPRSSRSRPRRRRRLRAVRAGAQALDEAITAFQQAQQTASSRRPGRRRAGRAPRGRQPAAPPGPTPSG